MDRAATQAFFARRQELFNTQKVDELAHTHTEDGTVSSPMLGSLCGRADIARSYAQLFRAFSDFSFAADDLFIDADRVAQPFTATATHTGDFMGLHGTGRHVTFYGVMLYDLHDGLIAHERRIYDFTGILMQVGVLRAKPAK